MLENTSLMGTASQTSAGYSPVCTDPFSVLGESLQSECLPLCGQREPREFMKETIPHTS